MKKSLILLLIACCDITSSFAQVSFNDLLMVSKVGQQELVGAFLNERNFSFQGRIDKDKDGWSVDKWSYSGGSTLLEYRSTVELNKETGKFDELHRIIFFTASTSVYDAMLSQMKRRGWATEGKLFTGANMEGFNSRLYYGEKTLYSKMTGILVGENSDYRGATTYRLLFL